MNSLIEKMLLWIAWHLPKELISHCYARVVNIAMQKHPDKAISDINAIDALEDWVYS